MGFLPRELKSDRGNYSKYQFAQEEGWKVANLDELL